MVKEGGPLGRGGLIKHEQMEINKMKIALPIANNRLCEHFGHCEKFYVVDVVDGKIDNPKMLTPPPHEPGVIPKWLGENNVSVVIAGGMGPMAVQLLEGNGMEVVIGVAAGEPEKIVNDYINGTLKSGENVCDH